MAAPTKSKPSSRRVYKTWKGNNIFFWGGRLIFGPDLTSLFITVLLVSGPALTFCFQVYRKMKYHAIHSKDEVDDHRSKALRFPVLIVTMAGLILDLIFLFLTSSRDPGIVQRNKVPPDSDEFSVNTPSMEWLNGRTPHLRLPRTKDVTVNGFTVKVKYCDTCQLYRPPRASHCSICNNCVQKFDHHCPWVDQCVGLRNYRFFFLFISTSTFLCVYVFTLSWLNISEQKKYHSSLLKSMTGEVISVVLLVYTFVSVWFVGGLTIFHLYLISKNQTTYENFRYRYEKKENPYDKDLLRNFAEAFFSRMPPPVDFTSWAVEEEEEEEEAAEGRSPCPDIGTEVVVSSRDKGGVVEVGGSSSYVGTNILHNLDYTSATDDDDDRNHKEDDAQDVVDGGGQVGVSAMAEEEEGSHGALPPPPADPDVCHPSALR